jgi:hypothetical protein
MKKGKITNASSSSNMPSLTDSTYKKISNEFPTLGAENNPKKSELTPVSQGYDQVDTEELKKFVELPSIKPLWDRFLTYRKTQKSQVSSQ